MTWRRGTGTACRRSWRRMPPPSACQMSHSSPSNYRFVLPALLQLPQPGSRQSGPLRFPDPAPAALRCTGPPAALCATWPASLSPRPPPSTCTDPTCCFFLPAPVRVPCLPACLPAGWAEAVRECCGPCARRHGAAGVWVAAGASHQLWRPRGQVLVGAACGCLLPASDGMVWPYAGGGCRDEGRGQALQNRGR
jgi:hypothetical protein